MSKDKHRYTSLNNNKSNYDDSDAEIDNDSSFINPSNPTMKQEVFFI